jgi:4'-phosphopantetheinyl transferase
MTALVHTDAVTAPAADEIVVVRRELAVADDVLARLAATLSPDEQARVARYAFEHLRRDATVSRGTLRELLAEMARTTPASLAFVDGPQGKPALSGTLDFNVSHTERWLYVAVTQARALGVDVEGGRAIDVDELAPAVFTPQERAELATHADRELAFLRGWTRKEAYLKARGTGLSTPLHEFSVSLGSPVTLVTHVDHGAAFDLVDLPAPDRHAAALAWRRTAIPVARVTLAGW